MLNTQRRLRDTFFATEAMDEGHCGLPTEELTPLAEKLLEVSQELIRTALDLELQEGTVVADRVTFLRQSRMLVRSTPRSSPSFQKSSLSSRLGVTTRR